ncbi:MAG: sulfite exporter TauE/SafE family protein [Flavobacteriaceae bacterium]|nr:sulfite exporter TauE/SafE family protein [Flavobacteriaceae bacterium]
MNDILQSGLLIIVGMLAGVINTLAGGGSLLTLPVLIFMGLPPNVANATNRIGIAFQALIGTAGYRSKGVSNFPFNIYLGISALIGSLIGAQIAVDIKGETFNKLLAIIMLFVVAVIVFKPKASSLQLPERLTGKYLFYAIIGFFFIGIYGGFINAGIGFIIILFLNNVNRLSLIKTNATKVSLVFIYTCGALALFAYNGKVDWSTGFVLAIGTSIGAWWSSRWSVDKGEGVIKIAMVIMVSLMSIKLWFF